MRTKGTLITVDGYLLIMTVIFHGQLLRAAYQVASVWPTERKPKAWPRLTDEEKGKGDKTTTKHAIAPL